MYPITKHDQVPSQPGALASRYTEPKWGKQEPEAQRRLTGDRHGTRWPAAQS